MENINRELKLEREDRNHRREIGALSAEEKLEQDMIEEMENERNEKIAIV